MSIATAPSALDLVLGMGKKVAGKSAKAKVTVDESLALLLDKYFENDRLSKSHKSQAETFRDQIVAHAKPMFYDACKLAGKSLSSVNVGKGTMTVTNNYSLIDATYGEALASAFGDNYSSFFKRHIELSVKKESSNNDDFLNELVERVGAEFFQEHFVVKSGIKCTDALHTAIALDASTREKVQPFVDGQIIKPYSPSIKLA